MLQRRTPPVVTLSEALDELLGGGIHMKQVVEFSGVPGIGKTQLAIQLACNATIPSIVEGVDGSAVYIDTEGSFVPQRALQIAQGLINKLHQVTAPFPTHAKAVQTLTARNVLSRIHVFRVFDQAELLAVIAAMRLFLTNNHRDVRVLIVDSIAFHFRRSSADAAHRSRVLHALGADLHRLAVDFNLGVVLINQVTTKFLSSTPRPSSNTASSSSSSVTNSHGTTAASSSTGVPQRTVSSGYISYGSVKKHYSTSTSSMGGEGADDKEDNSTAANSSSSSSSGGGKLSLSSERSIIAPALGDTWAHVAASRVLLFWSGARRIARVFKSPTLPVTERMYVVTGDGIRDVEGEGGGERGEQEQEVGEEVEGVENGDGDGDAAGGGEDDDALRSVSIPSVSAASSSSTPASSASMRSPATSTSTSTSSRVRKSMSPSSSSSTAAVTTVSTSTSTSTPVQTKPSTPSAVGVGSQRGGTVGVYSQPNMDTRLSQQQQQQQQRGVGVGGGGGEEGGEVVEFVRSLEEDGEVGTVAGAVAVAAGDDDDL